MLAYLWFCVMLRAVSPGADEIITRYNRAMEAFLSAGMDSMPAPALAAVADLPEATPVHGMQHKLERAFRRYA
ncbi:MAG: hypothetical protein JNJ73_21515 [Hyphomonadaceae bacterium]|nr:hypothetical protein [Hyphomonadaceae bacterium]